MTEKGVLYRAAPLTIPGQGSVDLPSFSGDRIPIGHQVKQPALVHYDEVKSYGVSFVVNCGRAGAVRINLVPSLDGSRSGALRPIRTYGTAI